MRRTFLAAAAAFVFASGAFAQDVPATVEFSLVASMNSLRDNTKHDVFNIGIKDALSAISFEMKCQAARSAMFGMMRNNEECGVGGKGQVQNPANKQWFPRTEYSGGFTVDKKGLAEGSTLRVNYNAIGGNTPPATAFGGNILMKPEIPSTFAEQIRNTALAKYKEKTGTGSGVIDDRIDTVEFERLSVPSIGLPSDKGCTWTGPGVYAYQTESWLMQFSAKCGGKDYKFTGNMSWVDIDDEKAQYVLNLVLDNPANTEMSDADLFVAETDSDLFAAANGITATIDITQSGFVTIKVDGADEELASQIEAKGTFQGTGVPLETVRSFAVVFGLLSRTMFGA